MTVSVTRRAGGRWRNERDYWLATTDETHCWIPDWCGNAYVDRTLPGTHPWGATADHEVPLWLGGPELPSQGAVLRLAHNRCNAARSNRLRAQLAARGEQPSPAPLPQPRTSRRW